MKKLCLLFILSVFLSACSLLHVQKRDVEQGNIITDEMLSKVHRGMTEGQVRSVMGSPVLINTFRDNRLDYVYTFKPGYGPMTRNSVTFIFRRGVVTEIQ